MTVWVCVEFHVTQSDAEPDRCLQPCVTQSSAVLRSTCRAPVVQGCELALAAYLAGGPAAVLALVEDRDDLPEVAEMRARGVRMSMRYREWPRCPECRGHGRLDDGVRDRGDCARCDGRGYLRPAAGLR